MENWRSILMLSPAELQVLERRRQGPAGVDKAAVALLVDHDAASARQEICAEEAKQRRYFRRAMPPQPGRFGYSACGIARLAACDVLCHRPAERELQELSVAFEPEIAAATWNDCGRPAVEVALALLAWLSKDEARCARHLVRCSPEGVLDAMVTEVLSRLVRDRSNEIADVLARRGLEYCQAMSGGLWRKDPDAFLHVRLLAALGVAAERGRLALRELPDAIPYVPPLVPGG